MVIEALPSPQPPPPSADSHCSNSYMPAIGDLCLAYFDPSDCHAPSCITVPLWGRGRLLGVEPGARLRLLSIDYGVTATLPFSHILPLPPQCKGIPPLVSTVHDNHIHDIVLLSNMLCSLSSACDVPVCRPFRANCWEWLLFQCALWYRRTVQVRGQRSE